MDCYHSRLVGPVYNMLRVNAAVGPECDVFRIKVSVGAECNVFKVKVSTVLMSKVSTTTTVMTTSDEELRVATTLLYKMGVPGMTLSVPVPVGAGRDSVSVLIWCNTVVNVEVSVSNCIAVMCRFRSRRVPC